MAQVIEDTVARSKTILLVEDDRAIREILEEILEDEGYEVVPAHDGVDALEKLSDTTPTVILLDLMMPRMDGVTFAEELQRRGARPGIPIVMLSADRRGRQKALLAQAEGYLEKPFGIQSLLQEVERFAQ